MQELAQRMSLLTPSDQFLRWMQAVAFRDLSCTDNLICQVSTFYAPAAAANLANDSRAQDTHSSDCNALSTVHNGFCPDLVFAFRRYS